MTHTPIFHASGILHPQTAEETFAISRRAPAAALAFFVQRYWIIEWDLRMRPPHRQETLPYPCVNLAIEAERSGIFGVSSGRSSRRLEQQGKVFGVKFRPGAFYPFFQQPIANLTDRTISLESVFGTEVHCLEAAILGETSYEAMIAHFERFLATRLPAEDDTVTLINQLIDRIAADRSITRVEDVACEAGMSARTLQRIFSQYVGVSPKWVIKRARLHEAAEQLAACPNPDLARLACELGYFDQAHFIKDFKALVGMPPLEYARQQADHVLETAALSLTMR